MQKFRFLEHTADAMFEAYGRDLNELFQNAALALQTIQVDPKTVTPKEKQTITLEKTQIDMLLFDFLQELIYLKDATETIFSKFKVNIKETKTKDNLLYILTADCFGEKINRKKHDLDRDAKAVTLHKFEVKKEDGQWIARVIIDI